MGRVVRDEDEVRETPASVVWAVAMGTAPLPFLAVYSVLFIIHGSVHPVAPPDITTTRHGELVAGLIALGLFVACVLTLLWMLSGRRRWPFVVVQLGILATAIDFYVDVTKGGRLVSFVVAVAALAALICAFLPQSWQHVGRTVPQLRRRAQPAEPAEDSATRQLPAVDEAKRNPQSV